MACNLINSYLLFGRVYCLYSKGLILKIEAVGSSETWQIRILQDKNFCCHRSENLGSHTEI